MKLHFGPPTFPWHVKARLPSVYARGMEYGTYQHGQIIRAFGISFGHRRFLGFIMAGPFVQERNCIPTDPAPQATESPLPPSKVREESNPDLEEVAAAIGFVLDNTRWEDCGDGFKETCRECAAAAMSVLREEE